MSEETMVTLVQLALEREGIHDETLAVGEFSRRGHTGGLFAGIVIRGDIGKAFGGVDEAVGLAAGSLAGMKAADTACGLPSVLELIDAGSGSRIGLEGSRVPPTHSEDVIAALVR